jgi:hypothetical protein
MKTYMRREGKTLRILDLCTGWKWLGSRSDCFIQAKDPRLPLDNRLDGVYTQYYDTESVVRSLYSVMMAAAIGTAAPSGGEVRRSLGAERMGDNALITATSRIYSWQK